MKISWFLRVGLCVTLSVAQDLAALSACPVCIWFPVLEDVLRITAMQPLSVGTGCMVLISPPRGTPVLLEASLVFLPLLACDDPWLTLDSAVANVY